jgi:serine-type D-Ala-D-Ala carboxypeptidase/endopeptidase (penicillin-binding protein 4)
VTRPLCRALAAALLLAPALAYSAEPAAKDLPAALRAIAGAGALSASRSGIYVADVETGQTVFGKDEDVLLNPASNVKLVTTAAALSRLGPEYRFGTEFLVDAGGADRGGAVKTLYVRGRGDPSIVTERLWGMAGDLAHLGLRRAGEIVVDDGFFDRERVGPGFDQEGGDRAYLAPAGALSLNFNTITVHAGPGEARGAKGRVELEPDCDHFDVENRTLTVAANGRRRVTVSAVALPNGRQRIVVEGRIPLASRPQASWRRIDEPALYFGSALKRLLELRGVKVGKVRAGAVPEGARLVHVSESDALAEIVRRLNKTSNNFVAEQLVKTLGAEARGAPGTWPKGVAAIEDFLADQGIARGAYVMKNGSGLNDTNRFSARQLVTLLRAMWARFPVAPEYVVSLPVAARDGTIRWRMEGTEAAGRLRAKTGTLENASSLSGYVQTAGGRMLAFAFLVNDFPGRASGVARSLDAMGAALAASGGAPADLGRAVALAKGGATPAPAPAADLAQALRTYYGMARSGDPRNERFLRTALRGEADPALRLAIAECVYLSEPDGDTARRTFLDALATDPQALARLWSAAAGLDPAPVLPSLGDLAGEGMPDAIGRLVELAPAGALDGKLSGAIAEAMASAADAAPEVLVEALRAAPAAAADAAVGALGSGLARPDEPEHPFPAALKALAARPDETGAFARALEPRLAAAVRTGTAVQSAPSLVPANATGK